VRAAPSRHAVAEAVEVAARAAMKSAGSGYSSEKRRTAARVAASASSHSEA
jgi:hypothetical protein